MSDPAPAAKRHANPPTIIGLAFAVLGFLALLAPVIATMTTVVFLAAIMIFWGILGVAFVIRSDAFPNRTAAAAVFGLIAVIGAAFLVFPLFGSEVLTIIVVAGLALEGAFSIRYALSIRHQHKGWIWMALSGVAALAVGALVIMGWPETATWLIGLGLGFNFLTTGIAVLFVGRAVNQLQSQS